MTEGTLSLPEMSVRRLRIELIGDSPLISHKWSEKARKMILDAQTGKAKVGKQAKNPQEDFEASIYRTEDGGCGFPSVAFKAAAVRAGTYAELKMTFLRGALHVPGELVPIDGEPTMREDMVRVGMGKADVRFRAEFTKWGAVVPVDLNERALSVEQCINLFRVAGFAVGVGDWRPEKDGQYGRWTVVGVTVQ